MKKLLFISAVIITLTSCKQWLEVRPEGSQLQSEALKSQGDLQYLLTSAYDAMANQYNGRVQTYNELMADNLDQPQSGFSQSIYLHTTNFFNSDVGDLYAKLYEPVFRLNLLMEIINDGSIPVDAAFKKRAIAEAKFLRAMSHFDLCRLWGQPYMPTGENAQLGIVIRKTSATVPLPRSTVGDVYAFILSDLTDAANDLPDNNGIYANKNAAKALMAKVYFQMNNFSKVKELCDALIPMYSMDTTLNRFANATTSSEKIFSFYSTSSTDNRTSYYKDNFRITSTTNPPNYKISQALYLAATADTTDRRAKFYFVFNAGTSNELYGLTKFNADYLSMPLLYLSQLKLMRAEANASLGLDLGTAINDINDILQRAHGSSIANMPSNSPASNIITMARLQRRLEFPLEGERVQDLKRIGAKEDPGNTGIIKIRNAKWGCPGMALQFPNNEKTSLFVFNQEGGCD